MKKYTISRRLWPKNPRGHPIHSCSLQDADNIIMNFLVDDDEVTLTVQNPGGTLNLTLIYTIISERPIEQEDVSTEVGDDACYKVAQVCK